MNDETADPLAMLTALQVALSLVQAGILTPDEVRAMIGFEPQAGRE